MPRRVYKKKTYRRRRKTKRVGKKTRFSIAKSVNLRGDVHYFRRMCYKSTLTPDISNVAKGGLSFLLGDVPNAGEFQNLFDQYRISGIKLQFSLNLDPAAQSASAAVFPRMYYVVDQDSNDSPASSDELRQYGKCRYALIQPNRTLNLFIRPKPLTQIYDSTITTGYRTDKNGWVDLATPNVPHYGFRYVIEQFNNSIGMNIQVHATYYFAMKGTR